VQGPNLHSEKCVMNEIMHSRLMFYIDGEYRPILLLTSITA